MKAPAVLAMLVWMLGCATATTGGGTSSGVGASTSGSGGTPDAGPALACDDATVDIHALVGGAVDLPGELGRVVACRPGRVLTAQALGADVVVSSRGVTPVEPGAQATATRPVFHGRTVLLVEDQAASREVTEKVLRDAGFTVLSAPTADEAVALLAGHQGTIDVLCSDVVMPGRPVKDLLEAFGAAHPNGATLLCSGFVGEELVRRGIAEGRYPVLHKPFAPEALLLALQQTLQARSRTG